MAEQLRSAEHACATVLVVDDDAAMRKMLRFIVEVVAGHTVIEAADAETAWSLYEQARPSIITLDLMMPGVDGYTLLQNLRAADPYTAVIVVSALADAPERSTVLNLGANYALRKPFDTHELVATVNRSFQTYSMLQAARAQ
jgi:DNA-binding response OmpR family regulator